MTRYVFGIRWDQDSTELSEDEPGNWWVDFWKSSEGDRPLGGGSSQAVATKSEAVGIITAWQELNPDHRLDLPGTLTWFIEAPERPEYVTEPVDPPEQDRPALLRLLEGIAMTWDTPDEVPDWRENDYIRGQIELVIETCRVVTDQEFEDGTCDSEVLHDRVTDWIKREVWNDERRMVGLEPGDPYHGDAGEARNDWLVEVSNLDTELGFQEWWRQQIETARDNGGKFA